MMDTKSIKEKLREMAKQDGDNALLPSVLLRLLEESEAQAARSEAQAKQLGETIGKVAAVAPALSKELEEIKSASKGQADKQTEQANQLGETIGKVAEMASNLATELEQIKNASKGQADAQTELTKTTGSAQMSALDEFKKAAKMAAIAAAVAVPIVTAILVVLLT